MKKRKWIYPLVILIVAAGIAGYNYIYQDHRDIKTEKAAFTVKATELTKASHHVIKPKNRSERRKESSENVWYLR